MFAGLPFGVITTPSDPSVFVDNGALNVAVASDAKWWSVRLRFPGFCLVKACPHQDRVADRGAAFDHAPNPDDRPLDVLAHRLRRALVPAGALAAHLLIPRAENAGGTASLA